MEVAIKKLLRTASTSTAGQKKIQVQDSTLINTQLGM